MWTPETEINDTIESIESLKDSVIRLDEKRAFIEDSLRNKFGQSSSLALSETVIPNSIGFDIDIIDNLRWFPVNNLLLFPEEGNALYNISNFIDIIEIYNQCATFTFYVTDEELSFLVCITANERILMLGTAEDWAIKVKL